MNKLHAVFQQLYGFSASDNMAGDGALRALLLKFGKSSDWQAMNEFCQQVRDRFGLPAPAVSVLAERGFLLWFAFEKPVSSARAMQFAETLVRECLEDGVRVEVQTACPPTPSLHPESGRWSAFIDPGLVSMFAEDGGLDMEPGKDRQADLLAACEPVSAEQLARVLDSARDAASGHLPLPVHHPDAVAAEPAEMARRFLQDVMTNEQVAMKHRLRAAIALLHGHPRKV